MRKSASRRNIIEKQFHNFFHFYKKECLNGMNVTFFERNSKEFPWNNKPQQRKKLRIS